MAYCAKILYWLFCCVSHLVHQEMYAITDFIMILMSGILIPLNALIYKIKKENRLYESRINLEVNTKSNSPTV